MGFAADIQNDAQGRVGENDSPVTPEIEAEHAHPNQGTYDGTTVPDLSFPVLEVVALSLNRLSPFAAKSLWITAGGDNHWELEQAIKAFQGDVELAKGDFNVARHFWEVDIVGGVTGLLMYSTNYGTNFGYIVVRGYADWTGTKDNTLSTRETHQNLEGKALKILAKRLKGKL